MNITSIWRSVTEPPSGDREGKGISAWGWSNRSVAEAEGRARDKIRRIREFLAKQIFPDPYGYGEQPLREEIIRAMDAPGGEPEAVVTRKQDPRDIQYPYASFPKKDKVKEYLKRRKIFTWQDFRNIFRD